MTATLAELRAKWESRRAEHQRFGSLVPMAAVCEEVLADLERLGTGTGESTVSPEEAARATGYCVETIRRWVRRGRIANYGSKGRQRVRVGECLRVGGSSRGHATMVALSDGAGASSGQVLALDVVESRRHSAPRRLNRTTT